MKSTTYRQLTSVHLLHRIWHNELELALQEVTFWEELLGTLSEVEHPKAAEAQTWQTEINQLHHFRRLTKRLLDDIQTVDQQLATSHQSSETYSARFCRGSSRHLA
ncbi:MAG: hypothetical protein EOO39_01385 [Cytophagaceae bacterium]|nr:MAG: hypothetical protein EOO39_01385 [Cytophagaceae bacterium]